MTRTEKLLKICEEHGLIENKRPLLYDIKCGIQSGIPDCCIIFWITEWFGGRGTKGYTLNEQLDCGRRLPKYVEYVPCPKCLKNHRFVKKIKKCKCNIEKLKTLTIEK